MHLREAISILMISMMVVIAQSYVWFARESLAEEGISYPEVSTYFIGLDKDKVEVCFDFRRDVKYPHLSATILPNLRAKLHLGTIRNEMQLWA